MKRFIGLPLFLTLCGCWSRPCCFSGAAVTAAPCKAEGESGEDWRIATGVCQDLEAAGANVERAYVKGSHLHLRFAPAVGRQLSTGKEALRQSVSEFLTLLSERTGTDSVSIELSSGDRPIATGKTLNTGKAHIEILQ